MRVTAFRLLSNQMCIVTLEGARDAPQIIANDKIVFPSNHTPEQFTIWAETQFDLILNREEPSLVTYKLTSGLLRYNQIFSIYYGLGILNLICGKKGIDIKHIAPQRIRPKAFGLPENGNIDTFIKNLFSPGSPWNKCVREAAALALLEL